MISKRLKKTQEVKKKDTATSLENEKKTTFFLSFQMLECSFKKIEVLAIWDQEIIGKVKTKENKETVLNCPQLKKRQ